MPTGYKAVRAPGHGPLGGAARRTVRGRYPASMTVTARAVRRPEHVRAAARRARQATRPGVRGRLRRPRPRVPAPGRPRASRSASTTPSSTCWSRSGRRSTSSRPRPTARTSSTPSTRCSSPIAGAIPLRPGKPNRAGEPAVIEAWTTARRDPDRRADRGARDRRGRRHVLAATGPVLHRSDAADERRRGDRSWPRWSAVTCASSTSRTGAVRPSSSTSCRSSRRSPTTSRSSTCRCCRSGCGRCSASSASA